MNRLRFAALALAALASAGPSRADTVQASSTTMLLGRQDYRDGSLQTAVPLYQILDLAATDVKVPYADLQLVLSTWGSADLGDVRFWQNGAPSSARFTGDVNTGYLRADLLNQHLTLKLGRQMVADGVARMVQLDGGEVRVLLPANFGVSAYAGSPVVPRFARHGGLYQAVNPITATFATGARASWRIPNLLDVGFSTAWATENGDPVRRDIGADFRLTPLQFVQLAASGFWSLYESRLGEAIVSLTFFPKGQLQLALDYRHVAPDLFLGRNSILAAFVSDDRNEVGGSVHWGVLRNLALDADYHLLIEPNWTGTPTSGNITTILDPSAPVGSTLGHLARAKGTYHPTTPSTVGAELTLLKHAVGGATDRAAGYTGTRLFGANTWNRITATLDLLGYFYDKSVNGEGKSLSATATVAYEIARGWRAAVAGTAGSTPFLERQFELMAKLVYDQTYVVRETR